ncbi:MAG: transglycosylase domain-containing protein, partial [Acidimicrobiales bacterium]
MRLLLRVLRKVFSSLALALVTFVGAPAAAGVTVLVGLIFLPLPATIPLPKSLPLVAPTILYDRFGKQIASLQQYDRHLVVAPSDIPAVLKEAVVADEDRNFYHHGGVDVRGTLRALYADIRRNRVVQGGSTITQQYVGLAYTGRQRNLLRKVREAILASQLDRQASKDEILYRYLTIIYLGDGNYGVGAAAQNYFHLPVSQLNASQSAALAGLIPAPTSRAPRENLAGAEAARKVVLAKMLQQDYLTPAQYSQALSERLFLSTSGPPPPGVTVVYPPDVAQTQFPDFVDYVTRWLLAHYPPEVVYAGGLRVQTTLDPKVQNAAYSAVKTTLAGTSEPLEMALASVEPQTGFVQAIVGGRQFGQGPFAAVNLALGGCDPPPAAGTLVSVPAT